LYGLVIKTSYFGMSHRQAEVYGLPTPNPVVEGYTRAQSGMSPGRAVCALRLCLEDLQAQEGPGNGSSGARGAWTLREPGGQEADTIKNSRGDRFLAAFNDIEDRFRRVLKRDDHVEFAQMAREYADKNHLPRAQREALVAFAALRNAISHGRYYNGQPIANPVQETITEIERLRDQITSPPVALAVLGSRQPYLTSPDEPISAALELVGRFDYSQIPVYDDTGYLSILTTNAIARWLAHQLLHNQGLAEGEPVHRVLAFAESHERAKLVTRAITATEAIDQLTHGGEGRTSVTALIVTHGGKTTDKPIRVIASHDLPILSAALGIGIP
jgi:CBS domain-containing protein